MGTGYFFKEKFWIASSNNELFTVESGVAVTEIPTSKPKAVYNYKVSDLLRWWNIDNEQLNKFSKLIIPRESKGEPKTYSHSELIKVYKIALGKV